MSNLEKLSEILSPLYDKAVEGEFPKARYAVMLTQQHRVNAWKFIIRTQAFRSPAEQEHQNTYLGVIHEVDAKLEADEKRSAAEIAEVMGDVRESWSIEEMFDATKALREKLKEETLAREGDKQKLNEVNKRMVRYRTERDQGHLDNFQLKREKKELEEKLAGEPMVDVSLVDRVEELVSAWRLSSVF